MFIDRSGHKHISHCPKFPFHTQEGLLHTNQGFRYFHISNLWIPLNALISLAKLYFMTCEIMSHVIKFFKQLSYYFSFHINISSILNWFSSIYSLPTKFTSVPNYNEWSQALMFYFGPLCNQKIFLSNLGSKTILDNAILMKVFLSPHPIML